jgi:hypothetical protein
VNTFIYSVGIEISYTVAKAVSVPLTARTSPMTSPDPYSLHHS